MDTAELLERVWSDAGLSQAELAHRSGTSRPTLSAYEHGRKSPTMATAARLLANAGYELWLSRVLSSLSGQPRGAGPSGCLITCRAWM